ncbi:hypothetical protein I5Q34_17780 [Streptomyces sp. AV19]|uniref:hypothetical protein n=1 Tax=Streptomyces sp. AV19 TaxID=2793068 RepID=UPI0018FE04B0|nr:hypothetical protein [Streptomyces sp. AV19]MBH1936097.1 hypothetical protein [Streptomyces sp. AV19]MDG4534108.1 hypothetical protein [Streptomyces sp. AV19]
MTYRAGSYVVDVRDGVLVQVAEAADDLVRVRALSGGDPWGVPPSALRLATREERQAAGLRPYQTGCDECAALEAAKRNAAEGGDVTRSRNATAAAYTHWIVAHSAPAPRRGN